jgi:hypothetical protein
LGEHELRVRAIDAAGNIDQTPAVYGWRVVEPPDTTAPETSIDSGPERETAERSASLGFSADEPEASFECSLDGAAFAECSSPVRYDGLSLAQHELRVRAIDAAGNTDASPAAYTWRVVEPPDTRAPETTIDSGPDGQTTSTSARFSFSSDEAGSRFACSLDGAAFASCESPLELAGLALGTHELRVRAIDVAGNVDATPATRGWTVVAPPPACQSRTVTVGAAADSWVLQDSPRQNYGQDGTLKVDSKRGANARAFVRFELPAIPEGCRLTGARLRLYAGSYKAGRTLEALRLAGPWTESAVTWATQPATAGAAATAASGAGYREWAVTWQVRDMYEGGGHGFLIRDAEEGGTGIEQAFHSREKGNDDPPRLVLTYGGETTVSLLRTAPRETTAVCEAGDWGSPAMCPSSASRPTARRAAR